MGVVGVEGFLLDFLYLTAHAPVIDREGTRPDQARYCIQQIRDRSHLALALQVGSYPERSRGSGQADKAWQGDAIAAN